MAFLLLHRGQVHNQKHKALLYLMFSSGLRVSEVVRQRPGETDMERYLVKARQKEKRTLHYSFANTLNNRQLRNGGKNDTKGV